MKKIFIISICVICSLTAYGEITNSLSLTLSNLFLYNIVNEENKLNKDNWQYSIFTAGTGWDEYLWHSLYTWTDNMDFNCMWKMEITDWLSFNIQHELLFFALDNNVDPENLIYAFQPRNQSSYYKFILQNCYLSFFLFEGLLIFEIGKLLPEYGSGYIWKPTNFLSRQTYGKSKFLTSLSFFAENFNIEVIYAPNREFIPDDYSDFDSIKASDDFVLANFHTSLDVHVLNALYFHGNKSDHFGLNYSSQIGDNIIPYFEIACNLNDTRYELEKKADYNYQFTSLNDPYFQALGGINYTPEFIRWTVFLELYYNGRSFDDAYMEQFASNLDEINNFPGAYEELKMQLLGEAFHNFAYGNMSYFYTGLHIQQNDQFFDFIRFGNTLLFTLPLGLYNRFTMNMDLYDNLALSFNFDSVLYAGEYSEFGYYQNKYVFGFTLSYGYNM